jgi:hypothetical protein
MPPLRTAQAFYNVELDFDMFIGSGSGVDRLNEQLIRPVEYTWLRWRF